MSSPTPATTPRVNQLHFTDRSRHLLRIGRCPRAAYLSTAFGPSGYGIQRGKVSVPLASGTMLHKAQQLILERAQRIDAMPDDDCIRAAIATAQEEYDRTVAARGLAYWEGDEQVKRTVQEQRLLIAGLLWCWALDDLPRQLEEYRIIAIEQEEVVVQACTCGIGDGIPSWEDHRDKGCTGIALQTAADWIGERRAYPGQFVYHESKTTGAYASTFAGKWELDIQPFIGCYGWEQRLGVDISGTVIHGFLKGQRKREKAPGDTGKTYTGIEFQDSRLVYAWHNPGNPPLLDPDWQADYEWVDEGGKTRRLGPSYRRKLVDDYPGGIEAYVKAMTIVQRAEHLCVVGPLMPRPGVVQGFIRGWVAAEQRTREALWDIYDLLSWGRPWYDPEVLALLDTHFPQSWQCDRYGRNHRCEFAAICKQDAGWQDPLAFLGYVLRRPHHAPELQQMRDRGLAPPEDQGRDEEE